MRRALFGLCFALAVGSGGAAAGPAARWIARNGAPSPRLARIDVQGQARLSAAAVAAATGLERGSPLAAVDAEQVARRLRAHPWIRDARALLLPRPGGAPGRLWLHIEERQPLAALVGTAAAPAAAVWVDASGTPFAEASPSEAARAPRLRASTAFARGRENTVLARAVALAGELGARGFAAPFELIVPEPDSARGWVLRFGDPPREVVLGMTDTDRRLDRLSELLADDRTAQARRIDLRFEGRAVLVLADWGVRGAPGSR